MTNDQPAIRNELGRSLRAAADAAAKKQAELVELLVCAVYAKHGKATICYGESNAWIWVEPTGEAVALTDEQIATVREKADAFAKMTELPPERCAIACESVGLELRVGIKERT